MEAQVKCLASQHSQLCRMCMAEMLHDKVLLPFMMAAGKQLLKAAREPNRGILNGEKRTGKNQLCVFVCVYM